MTLLTLNGGLHAPCMPGEALPAEVAGGWLSGLSCACICRLLSIRCSLTRAAHAALPQGADLA